MSSPNQYERLRKETVDQLTRQGCRSADWSRVRVSAGFDADRVRDVSFEGDVRIGSLEGTVESASGLARPCGLESARFIDCTLGDHVRVAGVHTHLARYDIEDHVCIEDVGVIQSNAGASFGNGVEVDVVNEAGGREVTLFNGLSAQFAHLLCLHRYRPAVIERLKAFAVAEVERARADRGRIAAGARIAHVTRMTDVAIGAHASIVGALSLTNGTVLSTAEAPTTVGDAVIAEDFIIAEGASVTDGAILAKVYVGQASRVGKQFSAENALFFANCEAFHGEACSVFAGPYTVTHHKGSLLIAAAYSFFNAGSATNASNHRYKLGPTHEGKLERGCKTGSSSYVMWPSRVGPFSNVLGKHTRSFDLSGFPFSHVEADSDGRCWIIPGLNLSTVGTVRDGVKWPARDRRPEGARRDRIIFDVLSPLTVGRMIEALPRLEQLQAETDRAVDAVPIDGAHIKRVLLRGAQKYYRSGIRVYLLEGVFGRIERMMQQGGFDAKALALAAPSRTLMSDRWVDIGGQLMPAKRLEQLCHATEAGEIADVDSFEAAFNEAFRAYRDDEWAWVSGAYERFFGSALETMTAQDAVTLADDLLDAKTRFLSLVLNDAQKEFDASSLTGFGQDAEAGMRSVDHEAVLGRMEDNAFIRNINAAIRDLRDRVEQFKRALVPSVPDAPDEQAPPESTPHPETKSHV